jgi:hypothetical protein
MKKTILLPLLALVLGACTNSSPTSTSDYPSEPTIAISKNEAIDLYTQFYNHLSTLTNAPGIVAENVGTLSMSQTMSGMQITVSMDITQNKSVNYNTLAGYSENNNTTKSTINGISGLVPDTVTSVKSLLYYDEGNSSLHEIMVEDDSLEENSVETIERNLAKEYFAEVFDLQTILADTIVLKPSELSEGLNDPEISEVAYQSNKDKSEVKIDFTGTNEDPQLGHISAHYTIVLSNNSGSTTIVQTGSVMNANATSSFIISAPTIDVHSLDAYLLD